MSLGVVEEVIKKYITAPSADTADSKYISYDSAK